jgi:glycosyltransferase involved in cell wall biosynthesis
VKQRNLGKRVAAAVLGHTHHTVRNLLWRHGHRLPSFRSRQPAAAEPRRVLHVTTSFDLGGTQSQIKHLVTAPSTRFAHGATEFFPELNYLFRPDERLDPRRYVTGGAVGRLIGRQVMNRNRRGYELVQVAKLVRDLQAERPTVVVGWGHEICVTTYLAAAIARVPHVVFCIRTFNPAVGWVNPERARLLRDAHRWMASRVSAVVVNSTVLRDDYVQWLAAAGLKVAVCANGVDLRLPPVAAMAADRARVRASLGVGDNEVVVTNVSRFSGEKGQSLLVRGNALLPSTTRSRVTWLLCGDGPTLDAVQDLARGLGADNVKFLGRTTRVVEVLAASDIFVMPSDYEGMPNAMMEAMAAGLPCISTTRSGIRDVARDGIEALYVDPGDAHALAAKLQWLVEHPAEAAVIGRAAVARVASFSVERFVTCFEDVLHSSIEPAVHAAG